MVKSSANSADNDNDNELKFKSFLETAHPNKTARVSDLVVKESDSYGISIYLSPPDLYIHCTTKSCSGPRYFRIVGERNAYRLRKHSPNSSEYFFLHYCCSNCNKREKTYSVEVWRDEHHRYCRKIGEDPPIGDPVPAKVVKLVGADRDNFLKGMRCENQGLGIGAFAYYRRSLKTKRKGLLNTLSKLQCN